IPPVEVSRVVVRNNLFARTKKVAQVGEPNARVVAAKAVWDWAGNVRDQASGASTPGFLTAQARQFNLPAEPAYDARFLRYPAGSAWPVAGAEKTPVGWPPAEDESDPGR